MNNNDTKQIIQIIILCKEFNMKKKKEFSCISKENKNLMR